MKRAIGILLTGFALGAALLSGCANAAGGDTEAGKGTLKVTLPALPARVAAGVGMTEAKANADTYTIFAYNANRTVKADGVAGSGNTLSLPADTYTVVVFAGDAYTTGITLLGTGISENVAVTANQTTKVDIKLDDIDYTVTYPESVSCGADYKVSFSAHVHGMISSSLFEASQNNNSSTYEKLSKAADSDTYSASITLTAPATEGSTAVKTWAYLQQNAQITTSVSGKSWQLPSYWNTAAYCQAVSVFTIPVTVSATGMDVTVSWADE